MTCWALRRVTLTGGNYIGASARKGDMVEQGLYEKNLQHSSLNQFV